MQLLDTIAISTGDTVRRIELHLGDLAAIPQEHAVDAVVISAFPNSYHPTAGSVIAALDRRGVSVADLAQRKAIDQRETSSCWLSQPIRDDDTLGFRYLLCFEPLYRGLEAPAQVVGDLFRSLVPLATGEPWIRSVAMPLVGTGYQRESQHRMMTALTEAAVHWMGVGLDIEVLKIVLHSGTDRHIRDELRAVFQQQARISQTSLAKDATMSRTHAYDAFISYSHHDREAATRLATAIRHLEPNARLFIDEAELDTGSAWQQSIFQAIDDSRYVVCLYSPDYLTSKVCQDEFNIGLVRHREEGGVLLPAYLRSAALPTHMRLIQYVDVREQDDRRIERFASVVVDKLRSRRVLRMPSEPAAVTDRGDAHVSGPTIDLSDVLSRLTADGEINLDVRIRLRKPSSG